MIDPFSLGIAGAAAIKLWLLHHGVSIAVFKIATLLTHHGWIVSVGLKFGRLVVALSRGNEREAAKIARSILYTVVHHKLSSAIHFVADAVGGDTGRTIQQTFNSIKF